MRPRSTKIWEIKSDNDICCDGGVPNCDNMFVSRSENVPSSDDFHSSDRIYIIRRLFGGKIVDFEQKNKL